MRDTEGLGKFHTNKTSVPIVRINELILEIVLLAEGSEAIDELRQIFDQVLFGDEIFTTAGYPNDSHLFIDWINRREILKLPCEDVDFIAVLRQRLGNLYHKHYLTSSINEAKIWLLFKVAVGRYH